eukprot:scaffold112853_cov63-Phaeocystis_antarctica.AAC.1
MTRLVSHEAYTMLFDSGGKRSVVCTCFTFNKFTRSSARRVRIVRALHADELRTVQAPYMLTSEEARQQAKAEELTLLVADSKAGYFGVHLSSNSSKPYKAEVWRGGKDVHLGRFATAEEAALCVARSPEGRKAAEREVSAPPPRRSEEESQGTPLAMPSRAVHKDASTVPPMPRGAFIKEEEVVPLMQLLDAVVKRERLWAP